MKRINKSRFNVLAKHSPVAYAIGVLLAYCVVAGALDVSIVFAAFLAGFAVVHKKRKLFEFCENGAKAIADDLTRRKAEPSFFAKHSIAWTNGWPLEKAEEKPSRKQEKERARKSARKRFITALSQKPRRQVTFRKT